MEEVKKIYSGYGEYERLIRHRMEFYINLRYIKENIPDKSMKILDLGGGPGRYAVELTKAGHKVTLIDLTDFHVKEAKRLSKEEKIKLHKVQQGDALDLSSIKDDSFDVVLAMGPFYHIKKAAQRKQCINEIKRVLKNDGMLFTAHLSKCAFYKYIVREMPEVIDRFYENLIYIHSHGVKKYSDGDLFTDNTYCENAEDILGFMKKSGFTNGEVIASEGLVDHIEDKLKELEKSKFDMIAEINYIFCKDKGLVNAASHLLYKGVNKK